LFISKIILTQLRRQVKWQTSYSQVCPFYLPSKSKYYQHLFCAFPFDRQLLQWRYEGYTLEEIEQKVPLKKTAIHERLQKIETFFEQTLREEEIPNYA
jgi:hypothetical protein